MPVKISKTQSPDEKIKTCYLEACSCLTQLTTEDFSNLLQIMQEMFDAHRPQKLIKDLCFLMYLSLSLYTHAFPELLTSEQPRLTNTLQVLLRLHYKKQPITPENPVFKICQGQFNELSSNIFPKISKHDTKSLSFQSLIQMIPGLSSDLLFFATKNLVQQVSIQNFFSLFLNKTSPYLPNTETKPFILVLDLDETLIHYTQNGLLIRPGAAGFIHKLSLKFEIVLFTSAEEEYANNALEQIDRLKIVKFRLYRKHLNCFDGVAVKDLRALGKDLQNVLIVDDRKTNFRLHPENGIRILPWTGDANDRELVKLAHLLEYLVEKSPSNLVQGLKEFKESMKKSREIIE